MRQGQADAGRDTKDWRICNMRQADLCFITLMTNEPLPLTEQEQKDLLTLCIHAAFADGSQNETERNQIKRILEGFSNPGLDLAAAYQGALGGTSSLPQVVARIQASNRKDLAYEMATCVCHADGAFTDPERRFLSELSRSLGLDTAAASEFQKQAEAISVEPIAPTGKVGTDPDAQAALDKMILNYAILNGALEIMPQSLATLTIIPLQMRMVYRVGKAFGYELGREHIVDFLGALGIGLTSQVVEGFAQRLVGGLARTWAGGLLGGLAGQATSSGISFATTYALGQVAKSYYASSRTLTTAQLKEVFSSMLGEGRRLGDRCAGDIRKKAGEVNVTQLMSVVRKN